MSDWDDALAEAGLTQDLAAESGDDVVKRGRGRPRGYKLSMETRKRMSDAKLGKKRTPWERRQIKDGLRKYWHDPDNGPGRRAHHAAAVAEGFLNKRRGTDYAERHQRYLDLRATQDQVERDAKVAVEAARAERIIDAPPRQDQRTRSNVRHPSIIAPTRDQIVADILANAEMIGVDPAVLREVLEESDAAAVERAALSVESLGRRVLRRALTPGHQLKNGEKRQLQLELDAGNFTEREAIQVRLLLGVG